MSTRVSYPSLYDWHFPSQPGRVPSDQDWQRFKTEEGDFSTPLSERPADFTISSSVWDRVQWMMTTARKIALFSCVLYPFGGLVVKKILIESIPQDAIARLFARSKVVQVSLAHCHSISTEMGKYIGAVALKRLVYIWATYTVLRYIVHRVVMMPLFPAQSHIIKRFLTQMKTSDLNQTREQKAKELDEQGFIIRDVCLENKGVRYSGLLVGHKETISNGQWVLQATGRAEPVDRSFTLFTDFYKKCGFNTLLVNGPSVGKSEGEATPESIGDAQEVGISFIETALKAKKIVIAGESLGGAAVGQAILKHHFKKDISYLVVRQRMFKLLSNFCGKFAAELLPESGWFVAKMVRWSGCEMDSVAVSKKLKDLSIEEVIVEGNFTSPELEKRLHAAGPDIKAVCKQELP